MSKKIVRAIICDSTIVADLLNAGYTCEKVSEVGTHETDCPLEYFEPFSLPNGKILVFAGSLLIRYEDYVSPPKTDMWRIPDSRVREALQKNRFMCKAMYPEAVVPWHQTDCPIARNSLYTLPDGQVIMSHGTSLVFIKGE